MLRAIIIDDEQIGVNTLKLLLEENAREVRIIATATDPQKGIDIIEDYKPDLLFLDISMPEMNGFDLIEKLDYRGFKLIFTTAHDEYAIKAIKTRAQDYLLKPIDAEELRACIDRIVHDLATDKALPRKHPSFIELSLKNGIIFVKPQDVVRVEASGSYTVFHLLNNVKHMVSKNLKECEAMLDFDYFYRCHPSHIVNLHKVVKMTSNDGLFVQMIDGSSAEISRRNKDAFLERLKSI